MEKTRIQPRELCVSMLKQYMFYYCAAYYMGTGVLLCMRLKLHESAARMDGGYLCGNESVRCIKGKVAGSHV